MDTETGTLGAQDFTIHTGFCMHTSDSLQMCPSLSEHRTKLSSCYQLSEKVLAPAHTHMCSSCRNK